MQEGRNENCSGWNNKIYFKSSSINLKHKFHRNSIWKMKIKKKEKCASKWKINGFWLLVIPVSKRKMRQSRKKKNFNKRRLRREQKLNFPWLFFFLGLWILEKKIGMIYYEGSVCSKSYFNKSFFSLFSNFLKHQYLFFIINQRKTRKYMRQMHNIHVVILIYINIRYVIIWCS